MDLKALELIVKLLTNVDYDPKIGLRSCEFCGSNLDC